MTELSEPTHKIDPVSMLAILAVRKRWKVLGGGRCTFTYLVKDMGTKIDYILLDPKHTHIESGECLSVRRSVRNGKQ